MSNGSDIEYEPILCQDLIDSWTDLEDLERTLIKSELIFDHQMCPDMAIIELEGAILSK